MNMEEEYGADVAAALQWRQAFEFRSALPSPAFNLQVESGTLQFPLLKLSPP
jgi:hypothetical protein